MSLTIPAPTPLPSDIEPTLEDWKKWKKTFDNFIIASDITVDARQKALLQVLAGPKINDIIDSFSEAELPGNCTTTTMLTKIEQYLTPKKNLSFERYVFRQMKKADDETFNAYILRLSQAATRCGFDDYSPDQAIVDQIIENCENKELRHILLKESAGKKLDLTTVRQVTALHESTTKQSEMMQQNDLPPTDFPAEHLNNIDTGQSTQYKPSWSRSNNAAVSCSNCGYNKHNTSKDCPARGKNCNACGKMNHFSKVCRSSKQSSSSQQQSSSLQQQSSSSQPSTASKVNQSAYGINYQSQVDQSIVDAHNPPMIPSNPQTQHDLTQYK